MNNFFFFFFFFFFLQVRIFKTLEIEIKTLKFMKKKKKILQLVQIV